MLTPEQRDKIWDIARKFNDRKVSKESLRDCILDLYNHAEAMDKILKKLEKDFTAMCAWNESLATLQSRSDQSNHLMRQFIKERGLMEDFGYWVSTWGDLLPVEYDNEETDK